MATGGDPPGTREEALAYIFEMTSALRELAEKHRLHFLVYLLEMAALASVGNGKEK